MDNESADTERLLLKKKTSHTICPPLLWLFQYFICLKYIFVINDLKEYNFSIVEICLLSVCDVKLFPFLCCRHDKLSGLFL